MPPIRVPVFRKLPTPWPDIPERTDRSMIPLPSWALDALVIIGGVLAVSLALKLLRSLMRLLFLAGIAAVVVLVLLPHSSLGVWLHHLPVSTGTQHSVHTIRSVIPSGRPTASSSDPSSLLSPLRRAVAQTAQSPATQSFLAHWRHTITQWVQHLAAH